MAQYSESLTVQILADSSQFHAELDRVLERMGSLNQQMSQLGQSQQGISGLGSRLRGLSNPLQQVSSLLQRVTGQVRQLSSQSVSLNVSPALQSLAQLSAAITQVAAQLRALSLGAAGSGGGGGGAGPRISFPLGNLGGMRGTGLPGPMAGGGAGVPGPRRMHSGGLVTGISGIDRVPAWLSAGEFVMQRSAVEQLGSSFLQTLNQTRTSPRNRRSESTVATSSSGQTVNQYGEITIQVSQPVSVNEILQDLQSAGHRLRNRRG